MTRKTDTAAKHIKPGGPQYTSEKPLDRDGIMLASNIPSRAIGAIREDVNAS